MFNKLKKSKIIFHPTITGLDEVMPIIPTSSYVHAWKTEDIKKFNEKKCIFANKPKATAKCPGINTLHSKGWIVRTWQDLAIITNGDGKSISWKSPLDQSSIDTDRNQSISFHTSENFESMKNFPMNTNANAIKFNAGWRCKIPKGYILYQLPFFNSDENRFTTIAGAYSYKMGIATLNIPVYWHVQNDTTLIKAGTPIAQLILVPETDVDFELSKIDNNEIAVNNILLSNQFITNYNNMKQYWKDKMQ